MAGLRGHVGDNSGAEEAGGHVGDDSRAEEAGGVGGADLLRQPRVAAGLRVIGEIASETVCVPGVLSG